MVALQRDSSRVANRAHRLRMLTTSPSVFEGGPASTHTVYARCHALTLFMSAGENQSTATTIRPIGRSSTATPTPRV